MTPEFKVQSHDYNVHVLILVPNTWSLSMMGNGRSPKTKCTLFWNLIYFKTLKSENFEFKIRILFKKKNTCYELWKDDSEIRKTNTVKRYVITKDTKFHRMQRKTPCMTKEELME